METLVAVAQHETQLRPLGFNCRSFEPTLAGAGAGAPPVVPFSSSSPITIPRPASKHSDDAELWAGPAYSNSPPPSSLPIPKFSLRQKRSASLDLPSSSITPGIAITRVASQSAPCSPTWESGSPAYGFFGTTDSATQNLRRILNLDVDDWAQ